MTYSREELVDGYGLQPEQADAILRLAEAANENGPSDSEAEPYHDSGGTSLLGKLLRLVIGGQGE